MFINFLQVYGSNEKKKKLRHHVYASSCYYINAEQAGESLNAFSIFLTITIKYFFRAAFIPKVSPQDGFYKERIWHGFEEGTFTSSCPGLGKLFLFYPRFALMIIFIYAGNVERSECKGLLLLIPVKPFEM